MKRRPCFLTWSRASIGVPQWLARRSLCCLAIVTALLAGPTIPAAAADNLSWPYVQAAIIQKVLSYTKTLAGRSNLKAVVIAEDTEDGTMRTTVAALTDAGMAASLVSAKSFADQSAGASVAFIGPGAGPGLASTVTSRQMLSFTTDIEAVRAGHVAVAVYVGPDRRPTIAINIGKAKAEGHSFAAEFLAAVEVIR